ncbi:RNA polymerase sigma factor [Segetibacter aerophilus]|uniref:DNA-directed RNA polymerase sigma-70 factor n=1 Tax=Segetibacter aerophilus TaxID=670293 RepID=A0A512BDS5_9BACT|nr:sigma-70 family RNA polymerase sigma factor [Segetibacter aerophilus]GEO10128.1 DNA-directed RNA polymerase sigma-70 factor [Segetibacter aerophilus]
MAKDAFAHIEDKELLSKFYSDGNNQWLGILLQRYTLLLYGVCIKYLKDEEEAKDAVQQIFLKVITEVQKYRVDYFKSWLYMVAKNLCLMKIREKHGRIPVEISDKIASAEDMFSKTELLEKDHTLSLIEEGLNELNAEQKLCVTLFYLQKQTYQQITDFTGFNLLQVKSYIQNGKRNLKLIVEKKLKKVNG